MSEDECRAQSTEEDENIHCHIVIIKFKIHAQWKRGIVVKTNSARLGGNHVMKRAKLFLVVYSLPGPEESRVTLLFPDDVGRYEVCCYWSTPIIGFRMQLRTATKHVVIGMRLGTVHGDVAVLRWSLKFPIWLELGGRNST